MKITTIPIAIPAQAPADTPDFSFCGQLGVPVLPDALLAVPGFGVLALATLVELTASGPWDWDWKFWDRKVSFGSKDASMGRL
jgi:hypothetical protein